MITGARQTGKTTLARTVYPELRHVNFDDPGLRADLRDLRADAWHRSVGSAVLDEVQKEPAVFEKVKYAFDAGAIDFSVLLGSSRFLLMKRIRETLAGRAFLYDLWPLMLSEIASPADDPPERPLIAALLAATGGIDTVLEQVPEILLGDQDDRRREALEHLERWGGMPALLELDDGERKQWLRSYRQTFLERDLVDLVRLDDLQPFQRLQHLAMLRSGHLLNYADLARDADISPTTARSYLEYLHISYQIILLRPFHTNLTSTLVKAPKLYWVDLGLVREGTGQWEPLTGPQFETLVVLELHKWIATFQEDARLFFYRTRSGAELDVLIETPRGLLGIEVKNRDTAASADTRTLRALAATVERPRWLGGLVVCRGGSIRPMVPDRSIWAVPAHRLFG